MTFIVAALLGALSILIAAIAALLGFDATNRAERGKSLGLVSTSERARILRGAVSIKSGVNQGTRVQATIPMSACVKLDVGSGVEGQVA